MVSAAKMVIGVKIFFLLLLFGVGTSYSTMAVSTACPTDDMSEMSVRTETVSSKGL